MVEQQDLQQVQAPSKKAIAKATGIALAVALVILFTAVLPGRVWDRSAEDWRAPALDRSRESLRK